MYFANIEKFNYDQYISKDKNIYAHIHGDRKETLKEHLELSLKYFGIIIKKKKLDNVFLNIEETLLKDKLSDKGKSLYRQMLINTIYMHDIGKINCNFQYIKMDNLEFENNKGNEVNNSKHSMLSALIYIDFFYKKIKEHEIKDDKNLLLIFLLLNSYVISKHHGSLDSFTDFRKKFLEHDGEGWRLYTEQLHIFNDVYQDDIILTKGLLTKIFELVNKNLDMDRTDTYSNEIDQIAISTGIFIYVRFLCSLLLASDYYATSEFKNGNEIVIFGEIDDINRFYSFYKDTEINRNIREYEQISYKKTKNFDDIKDINILRNEMFLDTEQNLIQNLDKNIFYLEAPTGSGKSNVSFNLSFKLIEKSNHLNKIFYVYPFNTLVEQNIGSLKKVFKYENVMDEIAIINSVVPIKERISNIEGRKSTTKTWQDFIVSEKRLSQIDEQEESDIINPDYEISLLDRQFLHYPIVLTTHVSIFKYFFGTSKSDIFPLYQLANSVIVLDEIQSYRNSIWKEIITFLNYYAEMLNIKIIIMSATLPNLNKLLESNIETINLINERNKYFNNKLFKARVKLDFSLLELNDDIFNNLIEHVIYTAKNNKGKKILIEFIKKKTAKDFYDSLINRKDELKYGKNKRDIELLTGDDNSIERQKIIKKIDNNENIILVATQVIEAGVDIDMDIGYKDISTLDSEEQFLGRINRSCKNSGIVYFFNLDSASEIYRNDVRKEKNLNLLSLNIREFLINKNFNEYYEYVLRELNKNAKRLNDKNFDEFINESVGKLNFEKIEKRMELIDEHFEYNLFVGRIIKLEDGKVINGKVIWEEYTKLLKNNNLSYAEKKVKLSKIISKLNYFIYKVDIINSYDERIGDLYYIADGEKYFINDKFDRNEYNKGLFI